MRGLRRRQHRHLDRRLGRRSGGPSSTSTSPAAPGAGGPGPTASTATPTCSPTWPRTRSRSPRASSRSRSWPTSSCRTAGPGKFRGGTPFRRDYRLLEDEAMLQVRADRQTYRPYGLYGGEPGAPSHELLNPDGDATPLPSKLTMTITPGDVFRHELAGRRRLGRPARARSGSGSWRTCATSWSASTRRARDYGVAIDRPAWTVDPAATAHCGRCAARSRAARGRCRGRGAAIRGRMRSEARDRVRIGVDIGGTFTDIVVSAPDGGAAHEEGLRPPSTTTRAPSWTASREVLASAASPRPRSGRCCTARPSPPTRSSSARAPGPA